MRLGEASPSRQAHMRKAGPIVIPRVLCSSQLRINMASGVIVTVINSVVLAIAYPVYLHFLGYEQYGVWLVLSTVMSFAQLGNLGINHAVMKLVAEEHGRGDVEAVQQYVSSAVAILTLSGVLIVLLALVFGRHVVALFKLSAEDARTALWLLPYMAFLSVYIFIVHAVNATLSGLGRMDWANYIQTAGRMAIVVVASILLCAGQGIASLLWGSVLSCLLIHGASLVLIRRIVPLGIVPFGGFHLKRMARLMSFGASLCGGTLINIVFHSLNRVVLSRYAGVAAVPVYDVGFNAGMQIRAVTESGLRALLPEVSRISAGAVQETRPRIAHLNRRALGLILLVGLPLYGVLFACAGPLLRLWLGGSFVAALPGFFRLMLLVSLASLLAVPAYYTLMGLGYAFRCLLGQAIPSVVHFAILSILLLLGKAPTLEWIGYATLAGVALGTLYLLARLRLYFSGAPTAPRAAVPGVHVSSVAPHSEAAGLCLDTDLSLAPRHGRREAVPEVS
jgi:O-antigen/teichoic acid export membrane protein